VTRVLALVADLGAADGVAARLGPLSPASQARIDRIHAPQRRAQSALARRLAALVAARLVGREVAAAGLEETADDTGPRIAGFPGLCVSIAHSRERIAVAVGDGPLGIDIERCDDGRDGLSLARHACSAAEVAWLEAGTPNERRARFYLLWTLREAAFKAGLQPTARGGDSCLDPNSGSARFCWGSEVQDGYRASVVTRSATEVEWLQLGGAPLRLVGLRTERLGHAGATVTG